MKTLSIILLSYLCIFSIATADINIEDYIHFEKTKESPYFQEIYILNPKNQIFSENIKQIDSINKYYAKSPNTLNVNKQLKLDSIVEPKKSKIVYEYDNNGLMTVETKFRPSSSSWSLSEKREFRFDAENKVIYQRLLKMNGINTTEDTIDEFVYEGDKIVEHLRQIYNKSTSRTIYDTHTLYSYNSNNDVIEAKVDKWNGILNQWEPHTITNYQYNDTFLLEIKLSEYHKWLSIYEPKQLTTYSINEAGFLLEEKFIHNYLDWENDEQLISGEIYIGDTLNTLRERYKWNIGEDKWEGVSKHERFFYDGEYFEHRNSSYAWNKEENMWIQVGESFVQNTKSMQIEFQRFKNSIGPKWDYGFKFVRKMNSDSSSVTYDYGVSTTDSLGDFELYKMYSNVTTKDQKKFLTTSHFKNSEEDTEWQISHFIETIVNDKSKLLSYSRYNYIDDSTFYRDLYDERRYLFDTVQIYRELIQLIGDNRNYFRRISSYNFDSVFLFKEILVPVGFRQSIFKLDYETSYTINEDGRENEKNDKFYFYSPIEPTSVELATKNEITIFPNPADDIVNICCYENADILNVEICDMSGNVVLKINSSILQVLDVSNLACGVYFFRVFLKKGEIETGKFVVSR